MRVAQLQRLRHHEVLGVGAAFGVLRHRARLDHCDSCRLRVTYSRARSNSWLRQSAGQAATARSARFETASRSSPSQATGVRPHAVYQVSNASPKSWPGTGPSGRRHSCSMYGSDARTRSRSPTQSASVRSSVVTTSTHGWAASHDSAAW
ncbi:hypothetical protein BJF90_15035 [Pseudonocardia sp. CNS-004]|nr:hypothetical protein BJF90_15035 [Pseudonocardia sp. CNS-004]